MKLKIKNIYIVLSIIYFIITIVELFEYFIFDSTLFGLIYLIVSMIVIFFVTTVCINYDKADSKKRISKIFIAVILGFIASFLLNNFITSLINYDIKNSFDDRIYLTMRVFKPIIYSLFLMTSLFEINMLLKKAKKPYLSINNIKKRLKKLKIRKNT